MILPIVLILNGLSACEDSKSSHGQPAQKQTQQAPDAMSSHDSEQNHENMTSPDADGADSPRLNQPGQTREPAQPDEPVWNPQRPPIVTSIHVLESFPIQYSAELSMTSPTGGWSMTLDRAEHADGGVLTAWLTITRPRDDDVVTTALVKHKLVHEAGTDEIATVITLVRRVVKGDDPEKVAYERE
ncbi:MAG: hypothetical protein ACR2GY_06305 [Phycisphaerales bacterium]